MDFLQILNLFNNCLVLIYGLLLSVHIAGGCNSQQYKQLIFILCPLFLLLQSVLGWYWGAQTVRYLYPLIIHLPLVLILVFVLKKRVSVAMVSVCTAYLCCQLTRWSSLAITMLTGSGLAGEIIYTISTLLFYWLLRRYFVQAIYGAMTYSSQTLFLFGSLPFAYYIFDYTTVTYSDALYAGFPALIEFLPTALIVFYVIFITAYHVQTQRHAASEWERSLLAISLKQSTEDLEHLRQSEAQTRIYRHDLRHHLSVIDGFLSSGKPELAQNYIRQVQSDVEQITPKRFCENELINLLCSSFSGKARRMGIRLTVDASVPDNLSIPDTELCSLLSNALENALHAAEHTNESARWVNLCCSIRSNKFLIEIKNPYIDEIIIHNGMPMSQHEGHGYGCRSIQSIAQRNQGMCFFDTNDGIFILRVILPM